VFLLFALVVFEPDLHAQFSSGFTGIVADQAGLAVPGAKVIVTNEATGVQTRTVSNETGNFLTPSLPAGTYTVEVTAVGFTVWKQTGIKLESKQITTLLPSLALPAQVTKVQVTAAVAAVMTDKSDTSREINEQTISDAPLAGRNVYTGMIELAPGVTGSGMLSGGATGSGSASNDSYESEPAFQVNAAGQRQENNFYSVDGEDVQSSSRDGVVNLTPEPDFIDSIRVSGASFDSSLGRHSGAFVQVFTKPGTNRFHGNLSEFHIDNALSSRTEFQSTVPGFRRNEFGGTLGGPILKGKLFFFLGAFGLMSENATTITGSVETQQFAQFVQQNFPSNLSNIIMAKAPPAMYPTTNLVTVAQIESTNPSSYLAQESIFPADLPAAGTVTEPEALGHNGYQYHARVDYNPGDKDRIFGEGMRTYTNTLSSDARPLYRVYNPNTGIFAKADWTHTFSPNFFNEASMGYYRTAGANPGTHNEDELPNVSISGINGYDQWGAAHWANDNFNWRDALTWTHGKHTVAAGYNVDHYLENEPYTQPQIRPTFGFSNLIDFAVDGPYSQSGPAMDVSPPAVATDLYMILRSTYSGGFVQDDWKVTNRLTVNLGLRVDDFGHWGSFLNTRTPSPDFTAGPGSTFAAQIASGTMKVRGGDNAWVIGNRPIGVGPRLGFGWDVLGNGRWAVRGGYGLFYNTLAHGTWSFQNNGANPPFWAVPYFSLANSSHPFSYALGSTNGLAWELPPGFSFQTNPAGGIAGASVTTSGIQNNASQPSVQVWMFSIQHDLGHDMIVEADYNGSHSSNLIMTTDVNRFPGDLIQHLGAQTRLNPYFGEVLYSRTASPEDGHYGSFMLTKRMRHNWALHAIYTFGKSTDDLSSNDNGTANGTTIINALDPNSQHGLSDFDVSKRFTIDSTVEMPKISKSGIAKQVLGGWRMSNIVVLQSGLPFTVYTTNSFSPIITNGVVTGLNPGSGDFNADGYNYDVPNRPAANTVKTGSRSNFLNGIAPASAFPVPALGQEGDGGRNTYIGPGLANVNTEFAKKFGTERFSVEFRADIFNLFNRVNLLTPDGNLADANSTFGKSTSQQYARALQLGLRLEF
jgi:hypothetical protein